MRQKHRPGQVIDPGGPSRRRRIADMAAVATFQPDGGEVPEPAVQVEEDPADEAVRRMVEAAYT